MSTSTEERATPSTGYGFVIKSYATLFVLIAVPVAVVWGLLTDNLLAAAIALGMMVAVVALAIGVVAIFDRFRPADPELGGLS